MNQSILLSPMSMYAISLNAYSATRITCPSKNANIPRSGKLKLQPLWLPYFSGPIDSKLEQTYLANELWKSSKEKVSPKHLAATPPPLHENTKNENGPHSIKHNGSSNT